MTERHALWLSVIGAVLSAGLGFGFFLVSDSEAVLLDGFFSLVSFAMGLVTIRVSRLLERPDDEQFHFGYASFEPMLNTVKGFVLLAVCLFAAASAVGAIVDGGRVVAAGWGVAYAGVAALICGTLAVLQQRTARRTGSQLVAVDARTWTIDGAMSLVVAAAFAGAWALTGTRLSAVVPYVDPGLVLLLTVLAVPVPIRIVARGLGELLKVAPEQAVQREVRARIDAVLVSRDLTRHVVRMVRVGREFWVLVHILVDPETELGRADRLDALRGEIHRTIAEVEPGMVADIVFTSRRDWA